ncbi:MAG: signal recognition particle-docking protein FtsY [Planctomycetota bacterium]
MGLFKRALGTLSKLRDGLAKTRDAVTRQIRSMLVGRRVDEALLRELEAKLVQADVGVKTAVSLVERIRADFKAGRIETGDEVLEFLKTELKAMWPAEDRSLRFAGDGGLTVVLVAGVNGVGKTTSVAKIAHALREQGKSVLLGACDTYRAGALRQLEIWSERLGVEVIRGKEGGDPAAVAFDACEAAVARGVDVLLIDTAGRMHNNEALMRQLRKIASITAKQIAGAPHEVILVLDATTGQNAVQQARSFDEAIDLTSVFLAKLDGSARGGVVVAIREAVGVPVKLVGVGERVEDVEAFDPESFVEAMFAE